MSKLIILDPSCVTVSRSHHVSSVSGHVRVFHAAGLDVIACTNAGCTVNLPYTRNHPVFRYTIYDDVRKKHTHKFMRLLKMPYYYLLQNQARESIAKILESEHVDKTDHIFVPTVDWILFRSMLRTYMDTGSRPSLHLLLMYENAAWMTSGYPYQRIIRDIKRLRAAGKKVYVYTETRKHALNLKNEIGFVPEQYPFPAFPFCGQTADKDRDNTIYVGALGGGRRDKGYGMLPGIINSFNKTGSGGKVIFLVQRAREEDRLEAQSAALDRISNVVLLDNQLSKQDYEQQLLKCDIALFPYSRVYATRGSGIVNEAVVNSIPVICSEETSLCEAIICDNGLPARTADDFVSALNQIIADLDGFKSRARKASNDFIHNLYNNPVLRNIRPGVRAGQNSSAIRL